MNHGNKSSEDKTVSVSIDRKDDIISVTIADQGTGFDPGSIANPLDEENLLKDTGRGIFIVQSLMDNVEMNTTDDGTSITITKKIA